MTGRLLLVFAFEDWARENPIRAFVTAWAGVVVIWLVLDWLGNPNRGRFRPQGPHRARGIRGRIWAWQDQRDRRDAEIRETLRTAYGKSSLRLDWSTLDETTATAHDEARLTPLPQLLEVGATPQPEPELETEPIEVAWQPEPSGDNGRRTHDDVPVVIDLTDHDQPDQPAGIIDLTDHDQPDQPAAIIDLTDHDQPDEPAAIIELTDHDQPDQPDEPATLFDLTDHDQPDEPAAIIDLTVHDGPEELQPVLATGRAPWQVGEDPRAPTQRGSTPTRTTVRSRAWKNRARAAGGIGRDNRRRMARGRPPRRWNPITGKREAALIDLDGGTFRVRWSTNGVDPYAKGSAAVDDRATS